MNIDNMTIGEMKDLYRMVNNTQQQDDNSHWVVGKCYLIRTVTMIQTGRLVKVTDKELVLEEAAWIADTGRFSDALVSLNFNEVEPFPDGLVFIGRGAIIDVVSVASTQREKK